jgi:hypothetical protein
MAEEGLPKANQGWNIENMSDLIEMSKVDVLNRGDFTVLMVSYWSQGLVLLVLTRKQNSERNFLF